MADKFQTACKCRSYHSPPPVRDLDVNGTPVCPATYLAVTDILATQGAKFVKAQARGYDKYSRELAEGAHAAGWQGEPMQKLGSEPEPEPAAE